MNIDIMVNGRIVYIPKGISDISKDTFEFLQTNNYNIRVKEVS